MNCDEIIWKVVHNKFCSFKVKSTTQQFCKNEYNVSGLCNRSSCPLANSRYATVREIEGSIYLFVKTAERAHSPVNLWEKIKLSKNFEQSIKQIDDELIYWPTAEINRCKQRLTRIKQYLIKMRKLKLKNEPTLVPINKKIEKREKNRERKAESAAKLEASIEKELLNRLKNKAYGDEPLNVNEEVWRQILEGDKLELEDDQSDYEEELEEELENEREFVDNLSDDIEDFFMEASDSEEEESEEEEVTNKRKAKSKTLKKKQKPRIEIEYEEEDHRQLN